MNIEILVFSIVLTVVVAAIVAALIPVGGKNTSENYNGMVVFDIDNTILCRGMMAGNSRCTAAGSEAIRLIGNYKDDNSKKYFMNTCGGIANDPKDSDQNRPDYGTTKFYTYPSFKFNLGPDGTTGPTWSQDTSGNWVPDAAHRIIQGRGDPMDARCVKPALGDGDQYTCSLKNNYDAVQNAGTLPLDGCSPELVEFPTKDYLGNPATVVFPAGVDCELKTRVRNLIQICRKNNVGVAINTARFTDFINPAQLPYYKSLGFTDNELLSFNKGGHFTYNFSQGLCIYTQAKQKALNMVSLQKRFNLPKSKMILVDDQLINVMAVRDFGFQGYHCSTTMGQTFGFSQDHLKDWNSPDPAKDNSDVQCGITKNQIPEILKAIGVNV